MKSPIQCAATCKNLNDCQGYTTTEIKNNSTSTSNNDHLSSSKMLDCTFYSTIENLVDQENSTLYCTGCPGIGESCREDSDCWRTTHAICNTTSQLCVCPHVYRDEANVCLIDYASDSRFQSHNGYWILIRPGKLLDPISWYGGKDYCTSNHASLFIPRDQGDWDWMKGAVSGVGQSHFMVPIQANDDGDKIWTDGTSSASATYIPWHQPLVFTREQLWNAFAVGIELVDVTCAYYISVKIGFVSLEVTELGPCLFAGAFAVVCAVEQ
ncbi:hypothetical protein Pmani_022618 [Petrolisthes manimaculis]|uniref:Uncharacterized protein n=1 Tax=Petrolisthes manimaculis TaxID=1843537 RepID=A0AAE1PBS5_9EUCA|nr:hypothetical protein Pmani_022618 [Petrolisthes manimaculis]